MTNPRAITKLDHDRLHAVLTRMGEQGWTMEHGNAILSKPKLAAVGLAAIQVVLDQELVNSQSIGKVLLKSESTEAIVSSMRPCTSIARLAKTLLGRMPNIDPRGAELVIMSVSQLGFADEATEDEILAMAEERFGLKECSPWVAPALRNRTLRQPYGERLYLAMKPIFTPLGVDAIFTVIEVSDGNSLSAEEVTPATAFSPNSRFVFERVQKK